MRIVAHFVVIYHQLTEATAIRNQSVAEFGLHIFSQMTIVDSDFGQC